MKFNILLTKRRGLSSIVGALLFVVLLVSAFAVIGVALNSQTDIASTGRDVAAKDLEKQQEDFVIKNVVQLPAGYLQVNLTNNGQNAAEIFTMVLTNTTDTGEPTKTFEIPSSTSFLPIGKNKQTNIVRTLDLKMDTPISGSEFYNFKIISSLGTIKTITIECSSGGLCGPSVPTVGSGALQAQLFLDGPNGVNTKTSTVVLFVQNTGSSSVYNVSPINTCATMTTPPPLPSTSTFDPCNLDSPDPFLELQPGASAIFKWDGTVNAEIDDVFVFCNGGGGFEADLVTPVPNSNVDCDELTVIDPNDCGGCDAGSGEGNEPLIILDDLLIRPSIFLTLPSPFGATVQSANTNLGIFGVQVANPTNSTFTVSKVTLTAFAPGANNNILIFDAAGNTTNISPNCCTPLIGGWNVQDENVMVWRDFTNPITLPPYSANSFLLKIKPQDNGAVLESVIVQASVFSSIGSFGKAGYQTTQYPAGGTEYSPIANVFLATSPNTSATTSIIGHKLNIVNGTTTELIVTMADMDQKNSSYIKTGSKLIINIPRQWEFVNVDSVKSSSKFIFNATEPKIVHHGDGSTQIIALTNENIGDQNSIEPASIVFNAKPPNEKYDRMYIMYILADGLTEDNYSVGPQQEAILHVIGNVTGYSP